MGTTVTQQAQPTPSIVKQASPELMSQSASQKFVPKFPNVQLQQPCLHIPNTVSVDVGFEIMRASALSPGKPLSHRADVYINNGIVRPPPPTTSRIFRIIPR